MLGMTQPTGGKGVAADVSDSVVDSTTTTSHDDGTTTTASHAAVGKRKKRNPKDTSATTITTTTITSRATRSSSRLKAAGPRKPILDDDEDVIMKDKVNDRGKNSDDESYFEADPSVQDSVVVLSDDTNESGDEDLVEVLSVTSNHASVMVSSKASSSSAQSSSLEAIKAEYQSAPTAPISRRIALGKTPMVFEPSSSKFGSAFKGNSNVPSPWLAQPQQASSSSGTSTPTSSFAPAVDISLFQNTHSASTSGKKKAKVESKANPHLQGQQLAALETLFNLSRDQVDLSRILAESHPPSPSPGEPGDWLLLYSRSIYNRKSIDNLLLPDVETQVWPVLKIKMVVGVCRRDPDNRADYVLTETPIIFETKDLTMTNEEMKTRATELAKSKFSFFDVKRPLFHRYEHFRYRLTTADENVDKQPDAFVVSTQFTWKIAFANAEGDFLLYPSVLSIEGLTACFLKNAAHLKITQYKVASNQLSQMYLPVTRFYVRRSFLLGSSIAEFSALISDIERGFFGELENGSYVDPTHSSTNFKLQDSFDSMERNAGSGFKLHLRDYQRRTLNWMCELEDPMRVEQRTLNISKPNKLGIGFRTQHITHGITTRIPILGDSLLWHADGKQITLPHVIEAPKKSLEIHGGILADDTGSGKTITLLALVHTNPLVHPSQIYWPSSNWRNFMIPSRATLVVCPSNLANQWREEAIKCMPNAKIFLVSTIVQHKKLSWFDIMSADLVIVTNQFLQNLSYFNVMRSLFPSPFKNRHPSHDLPELISFFHQYTTKLLSEGVDSFIHDVGNVVFEGMFFHRVVFDEFHELEASKFRVNIRQLHGSTYWGLTGTPRYDSLDAIYTMAHYLHIDLEKCSVADAQAFLSQHVKRNVPNLQLPEKKEELVKITLNAKEMALYMSVSGNNAISQLMLCCHYQLAENVVEHVGDTFMNIDAVNEKLQTSRMKRIHEMAESLADYAKNIRTVKQDISRGAPIELDDNERKLWMARKKRELANKQETEATIKSAYTKAVAEHDYFASILDEIRNSKLEPCVICMCDIDKVAGMTNCGHVFCPDCLAGLMRTSRKCAMCRRDLDSKQIMNVQVGSVEPEVKAADTLDSEDMEVNPELYGSKVKALLSYITTTLAEKPDSKFILFLQYRRLATLVYKSLRDLRVSVARVTGSVHSRAKAVSQFKSGEFPVIMLSAEDSVSGLHLVEATHILMVHPFLGNGSEERDLAAESQGIARAYRGGLNHPLKVVRFITQGTIEEELARRRQPHLFR